MHFEKEIICECGLKSVQTAVEVFKTSNLPYRKAKKLITKCNKTCCQKPLLSLYKMVNLGEIDYEKIHLLIEQTNKKF